MQASIVVTVIVLYFLVLIGISYLTSRKATNDSFFLGERKSPWYLVSFGMIGASLSGVTFLSVPGGVGDPGNQFGYMQMVFGYFLGYLVIAFVLLPLYYKLNLTSIYEYLKGRFGNWSYKTGAGFFLVSRVIGASVRLMLVANVLQEVLFNGWGVRFEFTVLISVALIWLYTNRGGIKTIVWTDTLQTAFMLVSVVLTVFFLSDALPITQTKGIVGSVAESSYSKIFFFDDFMAKNHFLKHFFGGMFITIGMTGLDQDMMQKNLSCKSIKDAQKNMISMATVLVAVNLLFLGLGALLYMYAEKNGIAVDGGRRDLLFTNIAMSKAAGPVIGILFLLGLIAAAYSSADSALTSLTTSVSVDFLGINEKERTQKRKEKIRKWVHLGMSIVIVLTVIILNKTTSRSAIDLLMFFAGFTYGPLIGMFFFGILSKRTTTDWITPVVSALAIVITFLVWWYSAGAPGVGKGNPGWLGTYSIGFELIIINALITFILMYGASWIPRKSVVKI